MKTDILEWIRHTVSPHFLDQSILSKKKKKKMKLSDPGLYELVLVLGITAAFSNSS